MPQGSPGSPYPRGLRAAVNAGGGSHGPREGDSIAIDWDAGSGYRAAIAHLEDVRPGVRVQQPLEPVGGGCFDVNDLVLDNLPLLTIRRIVK